MMMFSRVLLLGIMTVMGGTMFMPAPALAAEPYAKDYVGKMETYRATFEDTLVHLARKHGLGFVEMRAANPRLDPWIPGEGARVVLPKKHLLPDAPRQGIVINLPDMRLYFYERPGQAPLTYSISPGREGLYTPIGTTSVVGKKENPTWTPTPRMLKEDPELKPFYPPGPDNPLGTHALYLDWPQYRIHGTNKPYAIGRLASSGCIRMYPESVRDLYPRVPIGTKVTVVDQPVKVGWINDKMYIEVAPTKEQAVRIEQDGELKAYEISTEDIKRITKRAGAYTDLIDWEAVRKTVREHRGYPVAVLDKSGTRNASVRDETEEALDAMAAEDNAKAKQQEQSKKQKDKNGKEKSVYKTDEQKQPAKAKIVPAQTLSEAAPRQNFNR